MTILDFTNQSIFHIGFNTFFGVLFGALFAMFYDRIPSKDIKKGLVFSMIIFLITTFQAAIYGIVYTGYPIAIALFYQGFLAFIAYGLVLGYLYKK